MSQSLYKRGLVSEADLSQKKLAAERARANLIITRLKERILLQGANIDELDIATKKLQLERVKFQQITKTAKSTIEKCKIAVKVAQRNLEKQDYLLNYTKERAQKGISYAPGQGVVRYIIGRDGKPEIGKKFYYHQRFMTISQEGNMIVKTKVNEVDRRMLRLGQKAKITILALPDKVFHGNIISISQVAVDRSESAYDFLRKTFSGVMIFEITLQIQEKNLDFKTGMSAQIEIEIDRFLNPVVISQKALFHSPSPHVYVLVGNRLEKRDVVVQGGNERYAVIIKGINPGEMICLPAKWKKVF